MGCCLISQTKDIAPADKKLYALRDVTATIESIPLISSSVMSKKIAEGSDALVLDVKCGSGAFMKTADQARSLAQSLVAIGRANGMRTEAFITSMDAPLGNAVGNALEIAECVETLQGKGPADLEAVVVRLASRMVELGGGAASASEAESRVRGALASGAGLEKFSTMIARQGGDASITRDLSRLPRAEHVRQVVSPVSGFLRTLDAELVGRASMLLGRGAGKSGRLDRSRRGHHDCAASLARLSLPAIRSSSCATTTDAASRRPSAWRSRPSPLEMRPPTRRR